MTLARTAVVLSLVVGLLGCSDEITPEPEPSVPYETLSEYGFFEGNGSLQVPVDGVVPFEVISVLFSDFAGKFRFIALPPGETIEYVADDIWEFPVGTVVIKSFAFDHDMRDPDQGYDIVETRLLILGDAGWSGHVYLWNEDETEAYRHVPGERVPVTWIDLEGVEQSIEYRVPDTNQCLSCHGTGTHTDLLGVHSRQLNRTNDYGGGLVNQIDHIELLGLFSGPVPAAAERDTFPFPADEAEPVEARARAYLDANCAHCHSPTGMAQPTGLFLGREVTDESALGVCRRPFSAGQGAGGRSFDIVPGAPDQSIITFRMESADAQIKMPEFPSVLADLEGAALVAEWILGMEPQGCD